MGLPRRLPAPSTGEAATGARLAHSTHYHGVGRLGKNRRPEGRVHRGDRGGGSSRGERRLRVLSRSLAPEADGESGSLRRSCSRPGYIAFPGLIRATAPHGAPLRPVWKPCVHRAGPTSVGGLPLPDRTGSHLRDPRRALDHGWAWERRIPSSGGIVGRKGIGGEGERAAAFDLRLRGNDGLRRGPPGSRRSGGAGRTRGALDGDAAGNPGKRDDDAYQV